LARRLAHAYWVALGLQSDGMAIPCMLGTPHIHAWYSLRYLHDRGYTVGMFGKYLNNNPKTAPPGIDVRLA